MKTTAVSSKYLYIIDVAHGKDVPGKQSPDGRHKEWLWSRIFAQALLELLHDNGIKAIIPVNIDTEPGLIERCHRYNDIIGNKIMISIHNNAAGNGSVWKSARGFEIWTSPGQTTSDKVADIFANHIKENFPALPFRTDTTDGDPDKESRFTVLIGTRCPAILIENLFQDNKQDVDLLLNKSFCMRLQTAYYNAILEIEKTL